MDPDWIGAQMCTAWGRHFLVYWLDDRSPGCTETWAFIDRRLADLHRLTGLRERIEAAAGHLPNPLRVLRSTR